MSQIVDHAMKVFSGIPALLLTSELVALRNELEAAASANNNKLFYKLIRKAAKKSETRNP